MEWWKRLIEKEKREGLDWSKESDLMSMWKSMGGKIWDLNRVIEIVLGISKLEKKRAAKQKN